MGTQGAVVNTNPPSWGEENLTITEKKSKNGVGKSCHAVTNLKLCVLPLNKQKNKTKNKIELTIVSPLGDMQYVVCTVKCDGGIF